MPRFRYDALDSQGKPVHGEIEADDQAAAMREVTAQSLMPTGIREIRGERGGDDDVGRPRGLRRWIVVVIVFILIVLAILGSLSRTDSPADRTAPPPTPQEMPAIP